MQKERHIRDRPDTERQSLPPGRPTILTAAWLYSRMIHRVCSTFIHEQLLSRVLKELPRMTIVNYRDIRSIPEKASHPCPCPQTATRLEQRMTKLRSQWRYSLDDASDVNYRQYP